MLPGSCKSESATCNSRWSSKVWTESKACSALCKQGQIDTLGCLCRLALIECMIHRDDCSKELLEWGSRVQGVSDALHGLRHGLSSHA